VRIAIERSTFDDAAKRYPLSLLAAKSPSLVWKIARMQRCRTVPILRDAHGDALAASTIGASIDEGASAPASLQHTRS